LKKKRKNKKKGINKKHINLHQSNPHRGEFGEKKKKNNGTKLIKITGEKPTTNNWGG